MPEQYRSFRAEAVVLRHQDWFEADRLLWLFTRQMGKVRAVAKGVRRLRSRKAGHLEPFTHVKLLLARGRDLLLITQAETIDAHLALREDLTRLGYASYVVELLDRFTAEEDENEPLYHVLTNTLSRLETASDLLLPIRYFELRLLDLTGYRPQLFQCVVCESEIQPVPQYFSAAQGGVLCPQCGLRAPEAHPISLPALKYLRHFQRSTYAEAARAHIPPNVHREMETLMHEYFNYLLERSLNAVEFLKLVKKKHSRENIG